jgi:hypothetical protein
MEENGISLHCVECNQSWSHFSFQTYGRHAHRKWEIRLHPLKAESFRSAAWRLCPVELPTVNNADCKKSPKSSEACQFCWKSFFHDEEAMLCRQCGYYCCIDCIESGRVSHYHSEPLISITVKPKQPADHELWKRILEDKFPESKTCNICQEDFIPAFHPHLICHYCSNFNVCTICFLDLHSDLEHSTTSDCKTKLSHWDLHTTEGSDLKYIAGQLDKAEEVAEQSDAGPPVISPELSPGWETSINADGHPFFIEHNTIKTTFKDPRMASIPVQEFYGVYPLPLGWDLMKTEADIPYFAHRKSQRTTWIDPRAATVKEDLPQGWEPRFTDDSRLYYVDHNTQTTSFKHPKSSKTMPIPLVKPTTTPTGVHAETDETSSKKQTEGSFPIKMPRYGRPNIAPPYLVTSDIQQQINKMMYDREKR